MARLEEKLRKLISQAEQFSVEKQAVHEIFYFTLEDVNNYSDLITNGDLIIPLMAEIKIDGFAKRIFSGEPVQYVLGRAAFLGRYFTVNKHVLIPRMETEEICVRAIQEIKKYYSNYKRPIRVLDLGCGSGIIGLTIAKELEGVVDIDLRLLDISALAIDVAKQNAEHIGINCNFIIADMVGYLVCCDRNNKFDVIISNPPYVNKIHQVDCNVLKYEPRKAVMIDPGTFYYQKILEKARPSLNDKAFIAFETNYDQHEEIISFAKRYYPLSEIASIKDISLKPRIITISLDNRIDRTIECLRNEEVVAIPSETVYGLCVAASKGNFSKLCAVKERDTERPFSVLMKDIKMVESYCKVDKKTRSFLNKILPGPVTVILEALDSCPSFLRNSDGTVGVRISNFPLISRLFESFHVPFLFTSVNIEGQPCLNDYDSIVKGFGNKIGYVYEEITTSDSSKPSTIISIIGHMELIREGDIKLETLQKVWEAAE